MYLDNDRRPTLTPQLAVRVAIIGGDRAGGVRGHLLPALVPPGAVGRQLPRRGAATTAARDQGAGAARRDRRPRGPRAGGQPRRPWRSRSRPTSCPRTSAERQRALPAPRPGCSACARARSSARVETAAQGAARSRPPRSSRTCPRDVVMYLARAPATSFRGVEVERVFLREYPHGEIGAHLFGTVGEVTAEQLKDPRYRGVELGDRVGQAGIELEYDRFLRGSNGATPRAGGRARQPQAASLDTERAEAGPPAAPVARPRRAAGRPGGARGRHRPGRLRGDGRPQRRGARARLAAVVRPEPLRQGGSGESDYKRADRRGQRRAAHQPRDPGRLPDGLDLQADHRHGRARGRADHARHAAQRPRLAAPSAA